MIQASKVDTADLRDRGWLYNPEFPKDWRRQPLYSLAEWVNGLAFRDIQFATSGKPIIKIAEIKDGISGQTKFTNQTFDPKVYVSNGDLLFSWSGQPETSIDAFWWRGTDGWLNQHVFKVTTGEEVDLIFFYYLLRYLRPNFVDIARNKQTTGLGHVTKRDLENIEAAYPSLPEQRALAHILGTLDDKIELNRRMNETLEGIARAIFKSWFVDFDPVRAKMEGRHPPGVASEIAAMSPEFLEESEAGLLPTGWRTSSVGEEFDVLMGQSPPGNTYNEHGDGVPLYQGKAEFGARFPTRRLYCTAPRRMAKPGDTLVSVRAPVGAMNMAAENCCIGRGLAAVRHKSGSRSYTYYVMHALADQFESFEAEGTVFGSINKEAFASLGWIAPPPEVITAFERIVGPMDSKIELLESESRVLGELRDTLLPKLISGEVRVKAPKELVGP